MGRKKGNAGSLQVDEEKPRKVMTRKRAGLVDLAARDESRDKKKRVSKDNASPMQNGGPDPSTSVTIDLTDDVPEEVPPSVPSSSDGNANKPKKRKRRNKKEKDPEDSVTRIKRQVRYFFLRMDQEQNLLDAYSNEGWKGQSREKVRPEKELLRATAEIKKCKLRVREAMRELDGILLEGSIVQSAFDDDGQLDYQEIFCAICHSHDAEVDNDIILCDGACDRGFHQRCLTPPLETKDIPPGDDGWLCPACQCKEDCVELINDKLGTDYEIESGWECFFPDAVPGAEENDATKDMASDESDDDDDYDPSSKGPELEQEWEAVPPNADAEEGDAEQDQPTAADSSDSEEKPQGSGSDDEDDEDDSDDDDLSEEDLEQFIKDSNKEQEEEEEKEEDEDRDAKEAEDPDEMEAEAENRSSDADMDADDAETVSGKRRRKDVDYRKLHDEMFGWVQEFEGDLQLSEDEDWGPLKRHRRSNQVAKPTAPAPVVPDTTDAVVNNDEETTTTTTAVPNDKSKRIPQESVERLRGAFAENQLPSRAFKQKLSNELGLSYRKVDVWFKNERCSALRKGLVKPTRPCPWKVKQQNMDNALLGRLGEVEFKLHDLRKTMDIVQQPQVLKISPRFRSFENSIIDVNRGKRVIYKPVAEVVERPLQQK